MTRKVIPLSRRDRRALAAGVAMLALAWLGTRAVPRGLDALRDHRLRTAAHAEDLARAREALASEPWARESLGVRAQRLVAWAPRLFSGRTAAEAGADLAAFLHGAAALRRVRITRQDQLRDSVAGLFSRVAVRLEVEGDVAGIASWLADLEEGAKLIAIRELTLTAPEPGAPAAQPERLRAELVIAAWGAPRSRGP